MTQARINELLQRIETATAELRAELAQPKVTPPDQNPDYDRAAIYWLVEPWFRVEKLSYEQIAERLNELGHRTKTGKAWDWIETTWLIHN